MRGRPRPPAFTLRAQELSDNVPIPGTLPRASVDTLRCAQLRAHDELHERMLDSLPNPGGPPNRAGATASFESLFRAHYAPLCEFVNGYVRSREAAHDLVQDLFLTLWERRDRPDAPVITSAYLYMAARNRALKHLRHRRVVARWEERAAQAPASVHAGADHGVRYREAQEAAERAISELPDRCREIFLLSRRQHMSYAEIAEALDLSVKTVEVQMWRALKKLRECLAPYLGGLAVLASDLWWSRLVS